MPNVDLKGFLTVATLFNKQILVASGTATYAGIDLNAYIGELMAILSTVNPVADGSTTLVTNIYDSADNTTFAVNTNCTFSNVTATSSLQTARIDRRKFKRYIQGRHVVTGTTATFTTSLMVVALNQVTT